MRRIHFQGNGDMLAGTGDFQLRKAIEQQKSGFAGYWFPWVEPARLDRDAIRRDGWRIEVWYAHHGYFDAQFLGWDIRRLRPARKNWFTSSFHPAVVELTGHVDQGEATLVRQVSFDGLDRMGAPLLALLRRDSAVQRGDRFDLEAIRETEDTIRHRLREQSFAQGSVQAVIQVYPEEHVADIRFVGDTGPPCTFGEVTVEGNVNVPESLIYDEILLSPGQPYKASTLARTRQRLFALGTFTVVNIRATPDPDAPDPSVLPVDVHLVESRFQRLRSGVGLGIEAGQQDAHVSMGYLHSNVARHLMQLSLDAELGYALTGNYSDIYGGDYQNAPTIDVAARFVYPRIFGRRWRFIQNISYEQGLESQYSFWTPEFQPSLSYQHGEHLTSTVGYALKYFKYDPFVDTTELDDDLLAMDLDAETKAYFLDLVEYKTVWEGRDDLLFTRRGTYAAVSLGTSGSPWTKDPHSWFMGYYNFVKLFADLRLYRSLAPAMRLNRGLVLAMRYAGGVAIPYGESQRAAIPYAERFFIGGGTSVRGWTTDHLGHFICTGLLGEKTFSWDLESDAACKDRISLGANNVSYGTIELRKTLPYGLGIAAFIDAGLAFDGLEELSLQSILPAAGGGLRYASPIGPVRLDVGIRLDDNPLYSREPRGNIHFSLSEAF